MSSNFSSKSSRASSINTSDFETALNSSDCSFTTVKEFGSDHGSLKTPVDSLAPRAPVDTRVTGSVLIQQSTLNNQSVVIPVGNRCDERRSSFIQLEKGPTPQEEDFLSKFFKDLLNDKVRSRTKDSEAPKNLSICVHPPASQSTVKTTHGTSRMIDCNEDKTTTSKSPNGVRLDDLQQIACANARIPEESMAALPNILMLTNSTHSIITSEQELEEYRLQPKMFFLKHLQKHMSKFGIPTDSQNIALRFARNMSMLYRATDTLRAACFQHLFHIDSMHYTAALWFLAVTHKSPNYPLYENAFIRGAHLQEAVDTCASCQIVD